MKPQILKLFEKWVEGSAAMWQDMVLYWAWRGPTPKGGLPPTPTKKRIEYAEITLQGRYLNGPKQGERIKMSLAVTVFDDEVAAGL